MATIIVLFDLKSDVSRETCEDWAKTTDLKIVRGLKSIDSFEVFESQSLLGNEANPPYQYVEVLQVNDCLLYTSPSPRD